MKTIYIDSNCHCHVTNDGTMREIQTDAFDGKCNEYIEGYCYRPDESGYAVYPWKPYDQLAEIQNAVDRTNQDWEKEVEAADYTTDELGNIYHKEVGTDGEIHLVLIESYTGELFQ